MESRSRRTDSLATPTRRVCHTGYVRILGTHAHTRARVQCNSAAQHEQSKRSAAPAIKVHRIRETHTQIPLCLPRHRCSDAGWMPCRTAFVAAQHEQSKSIHPFIAPAAVALTQGGCRAARRSLMTVAQASERNRRASALRVCVALMLVWLWA